MKTNLIVKTLIIIHSLMAMMQILPAEAWSVADPLIEMPEMNHKILEARTDSEKEIGHSPKEPFHFEKKVSTLSMYEQNSHEFKRAMNLKSEGKYAETEMLLTGILKSQPTHHSARCELAEIYLKADRDFEAQNLLEEGLIYAENHPELLRLMSIVHERKNEPQKALTLLLRVPESYKQNKEYIALLGHVYQQTGRYSLARQQYFRLMQREPKNPIWLLGVSIALEAEGSKEAALEGYKKLKKENIDTEVLKYVEERIEKLTG